MSTSKYRSRQIANSVIAFSMSYERDNFLARGLGLEHLRELLIRLARAILRQGASLAYAGHWREADDNLMFDLLRLISAEQEDNSLGGPDTNLQIGTLYNHASWPHYLEVTPRTEASWIRSCRIVRIDQALAGIDPGDIVLDADVAGSVEDSPRTAFNRAVALSALRRLVMQELTLPIADAPSERVPPVVARILLGGKVNGYSGFLPGIFEEALVTMQHDRPTYILGGFGGAAEVLSKAMLGSEPDRPRELTLEWHREQNEKLARLLAGSAAFKLPAGLLGAAASFEQLYELVRAARGNLSSILNTGLSEADTRALLETRNIATAVRLVRQGLVNQNKLPPLAA